MFLTGVSMQTLLHSNKMVAWTELTFLQIDCDKFLKSWHNKQ